MSSETVPLSSGVETDETTDMPTGIFVPSAIRFTLDRNDDHDWQLAMSVNDISLKNPSL